MHSASTMFTVTLKNDVIQRNGKTHLVVKAANTKFDIEDLTTHFHSKALHPTINSLINKSVNTQWKSLYKDMLSEFEAYIGDGMKLIISSVVVKIAEEIF